MSRFAQHAGRVAGVEACWEVRPGPAMGSVVTADGAVDVIVRFDGEVPELHVEPATISAFEVPLGERDRLLGVRLELGHGEPLRLHERSLADAAMALWRRDALTLGSLEELVAARLVPPPALVQDFVAVARERAGLLRLSGRSERALQRAARQWLGLRPKTLLRIERARAAVKALEEDAPVAEVAYRLGFTDQPHLTRELRSLLACTPAECRKSARRAAGNDAP